MNYDLPPLQPLHPESVLFASKLIVLGGQSTDTIVASRLPGQKCCLEARADGTILEGNHRIDGLRKRGVDVDKLGREIVTRMEP